MNGADAAATKPVIVSERPIVPSFSASVAPMGVRSPTGIISAATPTNVADATKVTAPQWFRFGSAEVCKEREVGQFCRDIGVGAEGDIRQGNRRAAE